MHDQPHFQPFTKPSFRKQIIKNSPPQPSLSSQRAPSLNYPYSPSYHPPNHRSKQYLHPQPSSQFPFPQLSPSSPTSSSSPHLSSQMMKLLIEQNNNLKQQNKYLHFKLKQVSGKEKELVETVLEYESIMSALNVQNEQLQKEILYFSEKANNRVDKLGKKLGKLLGKKHVRYGAGDRQRGGEREEESQSNVDRGEKDREREKYRQQTRYRDSERYPERQYDTKEPQYLQSFLPNNPFKRIKSEERMNSKFDINQSGTADVESINNEFEALLYACRMEVNPEKRKELRRKLVELTYKKNPTGGY